MLLDAAAKVRVSKKIGTLNSNDAAVLQKQLSSAEAHEMEKLIGMGLSRAIAHKDQRTLDAVDAWLRGTKHALHSAEESGEHLSAEASLNAALEQLPNS